MKVLMVCLGNICRSPLAHGLLQQKVEQQGLNWSVDSAGTSNYHVNDLPDERSIEIAKQHGLDISDQRGRQFTVDDFDKFDLIFAMDQSNYNNILTLARHDSDQKKVHMILNESNPGYNQPVPDPYYGEKDGFAKVYQLLDEATDAIIENYS